LVTAYRPDPARWNTTFTERRWWRNTIVLNIFMKVSTSQK
jgi:hypothetical protein